MLLENKKILIMGIRNKWSIAWGAARSAADNGATVLFTFMGEENRGKGLGSRFLGEITSYLITEKDISDLKLVIQKQNKASRKIAFENGYTVCRLIDETKDEFRYFGKKGKQYGVNCKKYDV